MEIIWHGQSCFTLKGTSAAVVTDPYEKAGKLKGNIVTLSDEALEKNATNVEDEPQVFSWPGEYEAGGIMITAIKTGFVEPAAQKTTQEKEGDEDEEGDEEKEDKKEEKKAKKDDAKETLVYHIEVDGFKICHLGGLTHRLTERTVETLGDVDILIIPVGKDTIDPKVAHEVVEQIDPRVVIPMNYDDLGAFSKEMGAHNEARESLSLKTRSQLPEDTTEFVVLEKRS